jgi:RNA polymerase sigma factor (sigma-70 family)
MDHVAMAQDENALLSAALAADPDGTFEQVVLAHQDRLFSIALSLLGDPRDAEEVAQDALVRAYRAIASYPPERVRALALRGWLSTIVVNLARNRRQRRPASTVPLDDSRSETDVWAVPHEAVALAEGDRHWASLLARLPERYRVPVVLRHVVGLSFREMSTALGRPEGTLKAQVHRGLTQLRTAYLASHRPSEELSA